MEHLSSVCWWYGDALGVGSVAFQFAGVQCAAEGVSRELKTSETRMQRQCVRACVRVGAASDVADRRKVVRSVVVRIVILMGVFLKLVFRLHKTSTAVLVRRNEMYSLEYLLFSFQFNVEPDCLL